MTSARGADYLPYPRSMRDRGIQEPDADAERNRRPVDNPTAAEDTARLAGSYPATPLETTHSRLQTAVRAVQLVVWAALIALAGLVLASALPMLFGYQSFITQSGSMEPAILPGSVVINEPTSPARIQPGDVITFRAPSGGQALTTHRVVALTEQDGLPAFRTKGDANLFEDPEPVTWDLVVGRYVFSVPIAGSVLHFASTTPGKLATTGIAVTLLFLLPLLDRLSSPRTSAPQPEIGLTPTPPAKTAPTAHAPAVPPKLTVESLLRLAQGAQKRGSRAQAYEYFRRAVEAAPQNEDAWLGRAANAPTLDEAIACLNAVLCFNPSSQRAKSGLAAAERARARLAARPAQQF